MFWCWFWVQVDFFWCWYLFQVDKKKMRVVMTYFNFLCNQQVLWGERCTAYIAINVASSFCKRIIFIKRVVEDRFYSGIDKQKIENRTRYVYKGFSIFWRHFNNQYFDISPLWRSDFYFLWYLQWPHYSGILAIYLSPSSMIHHV